VLQVKDLLRGAGNLAKIAEKANHFMVYELTMNSLQFHSLVPVSASRALCLPIPRMITCEDAADLPVLGLRYSFGIVKAAQACGDFDVPAERGRRALRVHLGSDVDGGLAQLTTATLSDTAAGLHLDPLPQAGEGEFTLV
jgi:hypothetical protein